MMAIRLNDDDRALLDALVRHHTAELASAGVEVTAASVIRGLIRQAAAEKKLAPSDGKTESKPAKKR